MSFSYVFSTTLCWHKPIRNLETKFQFKIFFGQNAYHYFTRHFLLRCFLAKLIVISTFPACVLYHSVHQKSISKNNFYQRPFPTHKGTSKYDIGVLTPNMAKKSYFGSKTLPQKYFFLMPKFFFSICLGPPKNHYLF